MKTKLTILSIAIFLFSCSEVQERNYNVCNCTQMQKVKEDIKASIKSSNNMSDEEMEDVIRELKNTFVETTCPLQKVKVMYKSNNGATEIINPNPNLFYFQ